MIERIGQYLKIMSRLAPTLQQTILEKCYLQKELKDSPIGMRSSALIAHGLVMSNFGLHPVTKPTINVDSKSIPANNLLMVPTTQEQKKYVRLNNTNYLLFANVVDFTVEFTDIVASTAFGAALLTPSVGEHIAALYSNFVDLNNKPAIDYGSYRSMCVDLIRGLKLDAIDAKVILYGDVQ